MSWCVHKRVSLYHCVCGVLFIQIHLWIRRTLILRTYRTQNDSNDTLFRSHLENLKRTLKRNSFKFLDSIQVAFIDWNTRNEIENLITFKSIWRHYNSRTTMDKSNLSHPTNGISISHNSVWKMIINEMEWRERHTQMDG